MDPALSQLTSVLEQMHDRVERLEMSFLKAGRAHGSCMFTMESMRGQPIIGQESFEVHWTSDDGSVKSAYESLKYNIKEKLVDRKFTFVEDMPAIWFTVDGFNGRHSIHEKGGSISDLQKANHMYALCKQIHPNQSSSTHTGRPQSYVSQTHTHHWGGGGNYATFSRR